jgi:hypothetical protein
MEWPLARRFRTRVRLPPPPPFQTVSKDLSIEVFFWSPISDVSVPVTRKKLRICALMARAQHVLGPGRLSARRRCAHGFAEAERSPSKARKAPSGEKAKGTFDFHEAADGFFLLADYDERAEGGKLGIRGHGVLGWDPKEKSYTLHWFDNFGNPTAQPGRGQWNGDTLTFEHDMGDTQGRTIFELDGKDAMNFRVEMSADGKKWDRAVDGKYRRQGH